MTEQFILYITNNGGETYFKECITETFEELAPHIEKLNIRGYKSPPLYYITKNGKPYYGEFGGSIKEAVQLLALLIYYGNIRAMNI